MLSNKNPFAFSGLDEWAKYYFVPGNFYIARLARRNLKSGEPELAFARDHFADPAKTFIDAGANKGWWSYVLSGRFRSVHAFEPNPKMYRFLTKWRRDNVSAYPMALSDKSTQAVLRIPFVKRGFVHKRTSLSDLSVPDTLEYAEAEVETRRLDSYSFADVGLMKIDVEGHEAAVLEGARRTIERDRPILIIEIETRHTERPLKETMALPLGLGYGCYFLRDGRLTRLETPKSNTIDGDYVFNFIFLPEERAESRDA